MLEMAALHALCRALITINEIDEAEPLVERYRDGAKAISGTEGVKASSSSLILNALFHEVLPPKA